MKTKSGISGLIIILCLITGHLYGQVATSDLKDDRSPKTSEKKRNHRAYIEFCGRAIVYSANYEYRIVRENLNIGFSGGIGYLELKEQTGTPLDIFISGRDPEFNFLAVPLSANMLLGKEGNYMELGAGVTINFSEKDLLYMKKKDDAMGTLTFGYRYERKNGFVFRIGTNPVFGSFGFSPLYFGVSFGGAF